MSPLFLLVQMTNAGLLSARAALVRPNLFWRDYADYVRAEAERAQNQPQSRPVRTRLAGRNDTERCVWRERERERERERGRRGRETETETETETERECIKNVCMKS